MEKHFSKFNKLCTPAKIYFVLAFLSIIVNIFNGRIYPAIFVVHVFVTIVWTGILAWICKKGYTSLSWFLVLAPFVMGLLIMLGIMKQEIKLVSQLSAIKSNMNTAPTKKYQ